MFGNNTTIVWGFPIANYVWWIGIGNAGTLISALLLLTRQPWRASINRFAEAMTLFSVSIAGIFPIIHLGRPMFFYWLAPYPNVMGLWPQWRSALVWDFWAILSYLLFSVVFWYVGLIPDLATLRDRAHHPLVRKLYGAFALGFRGSAWQWSLHQGFYKTMAGLGRAAGLLGALHRGAGLRRLAHARLAGEPVPALLRGGGDVLRLRHGDDPRRPDPPRLEPEARWSPTATSTPWPRSRWRPPASWASATPPSGS